MINVWKNPKFWYRKPSFLESLFLTPFEYIYSYIADRNYKKDYQHTLDNHQKVIAVGGLTVGGSGKTIATQFIVENLLKHGKKVAVLSRGYGRKSNEVMQVNLAQHSYKEVGDEPLILARYCPVFVGKNRYESAKLAGEQFDYFVLDDGFTQRYLKPDFFVLVGDGLQKFGNGHLFPLGPNRLKLSWVRKHIDWVVSFNNFDIGFEPTISFMLQKPKIKGPVVAFCGLGYPEKFFDTLSECEVVKTVSFPDHYEYTNRDIEELLNLKKIFSATLVTTEKDFVKIPLAYRDELIPIEPKIEACCEKELLSRFQCDFL